MYRHLSQNAPVCAQDIFRCVNNASTCRSQTYPSSSQIFCAGKYRHMTFVDVRRSLCKNMTKRRCVDLLYYLRKYSHIFAHNDNIMTNTTLHILAIVTCAYMLLAWFWQFTLCAHNNNCYDTRNRRYRQHLKTSLAFDGCHLRVRWGILRCTVGSLGSGWVIMYCWLSRFWLSDYVGALVEWLCQFCGSIRDWLSGYVGFLS